MIFCQAITFLSLVILFQLFTLGNAKFQAITPFFPFSNPIKKWDISGTKMIITTNTVPTTFQFYQFDNAWLTTLPQVQLNTTLYLFTHPNNSNSSYCFLLANSNYVIYSLSKNTFCSSPLLNNSYNKLATLGLGEQQGDFFMSTNQNDINKTHFFLYSISMGSVSNVSKRDPGTLQKQLYYNNSMFYMSYLSIAKTYHDLIIFNMSSDRTVIPTYYNHSNYSDCTTMTIDAYAGYLAVNCGGFVIIRQAYVPYTELINITMYAPADEVVIVTNSTIVAKLSTGLLHQYNLLDGQVMDMQPFNIIPPNNIRRVSDTQVYVFNTTHGLLYNVSLNKMCIGSCNCSLPFVQLGQYCVIPTTSNIISPNITNLNLPNISNATNSTSNGSTSANNASASNVSINTSGNSVIPSNSSSTINNNGNSSSQSNPQARADGNAFGAMTKFLHNASQAIGDTISITSMRFILQSNVPLSIFFQQFWLYKYYVNIEYSESIRVFMNQVEIINYFRLKPSFLGSFNTNFSMGSSSHYSNIYKSQDTRYSTLYFAEAVKSYCVVSVIMSLLIFCIMRTLYSCAFEKNLNNPSISSDINLKNGKKVKKQKWIVKTLRAMLGQRSHRWSLIISLVEDDFLILCFYSLNQFALPYFHEFENKSNLIGSVVAFFILTLYSTACYPMLNSLFGKTTERLIVFSNSKKLSAFWIENTILISIKYLKSFPHSLLIANPLHKFIFLVSIDFAIIVFVVAARKNFFNFIYFVIYLAYQLGVMIINSILLIKAADLQYLHRLFQQNSIFFENVLECTLMALLLVSILKLCMILYKGLYEICQGIFKTNKIHGKNQERLEQTDRINSINLANISNDRNRPEPTKISLGMSSLSMSKNFSKNSSNKQSRFFNSKPRLRRFTREKKLSIDSVQSQKNILQLAMRKMQSMDQPINPPKTLR